MTWLLPLVLLAQEHVHRSEHYEVHSDVDEAFCRKVAERMERAFKAYASILPYPPPEKTAFKVRVFSTKEKLDGYFRGLRQRPPPSYQYVHDVREVFAWVLPEKPMAQRLHHEAFHQYFRHIVNDPPQWLNEGLAEYIETGTIDEKAVFKPGMHRGFMRRWREGIRSVDPGPYNGKYPLIPLADLVNAPKETWLKTENSSYCESWGLVHFLLHGPDAKLPAPVLKALKPGGTREENLRLAADAVLGGDAAAVEKAFFAHLDAIVLPGHADFLAGMKLSEEQKFGEAAASFTKAIEADGENERYLYWRGATLYSTSSFDRAEADLSLAVELFPEYTIAHLVLGKTRVYLKKWDLARESLDRAARLDRNMKREADEWKAKIPEK